MKNQILLIDDDPVFCLVTQRMLSNLGWRVHTFNEGHNALQRVQVSGDHYDFIFLDAHLPDFKASKWIGQYSLLRPLRSMHAHIYIVSAFLPESEIRTLTAIDCIASVVLKPLSWEYLQLVLPVPL